MANVVMSNSGHQFEAVSEAMAQQWERFFGDQPVLSPLVPHIWIATPVFFIMCAVVRWREGPERQGFNFREALSSLVNSVLLGLMMSFGPLMKYYIDPNKRTMEPLEFAWKLLFTVLMIDVVFYWLHRWMHENKTIYKWCHSKHHLLGAKHTVWGGLDVDFLEVLSIFWYLTLPFLFVSVTPEFVSLLLTAGAFQTALIHGSSGNFPPWPLCNASFHHGHHMYRTKNYAATFTFLDGLFGTERVVKPSKSE